MNVTTRELSVSDDSEVRLTLTVAGDSVRETYDSIIADLRRNARLKGFRRGKAPREVLVRKFGPALLAQATEQVIRESLEQAIGEIEHKPLPFAAPALDSEPQLVLGEDLTYTVTYDTFPQVELGPYRDLPLERPQVSIADADLERELGRLQEQNAVVIDKQADDSGQVVVAQGDVVTVNYVEQDDAGQPIPGSERRDFVFEVGTEYNIYQMDEDLVGMARGADQVIAKSYPADYQYSDLAGRTVTLKVTVTSVKEKQLPDLDDELAQDVSDRFETLDDLKADLRSRLQDDADRRVRARLIGELMDKVVETSQVPLPKSMVAAEHGGGVAQPGRPLRRRCPALRGGAGGARGEQGPAHGADPAAGRTARPLHAGAGPAGAGGGHRDQRRGSGAPPGAAGGGARGRRGGAAGTVRAPERAGLRAQTNYATRSCTTTSLPPARFPRGPRLRMWT